MSSISPIRATLMALALLVAAMLPVGAAAADFKARRGIDLDQWVTWPDPDRWNTAEVLDNFPEWKKFVSADDMKALRAAGLDFVRMPVDPAVFLVDTTQARRNRLFDQVAGAIDSARAVGLNVIVDLHTIPRDGVPDTAKILSDNDALSDYRRLLADFAAFLARYDTTAVALELLNEPTLGCSRRDTLWPKILADLHAAARTANPAITLVAPGACWGSADGLAVLDPAALRDDNVIWSFHSYEPFLLTHQSAGWAGDIVAHISGLPYPLSDLSRRDRKAVVDANLASIDKISGHSARRDAESFLLDHTDKLSTARGLRAAMTAPFRTVTRWADSHRIPRDRLLLGEFGMIRQEYGKEPATKPEWRAAYYRDMIAIAEENGIAWAMWSYGGAFGIVDGFSGEKADPAVMDMVRALPAN